jgi:uncharacterized membrane protein HdeD (DUF308 family)
LIATPENPRGIPLSNQSNPVGGSSSVAAAPPSISELHRLAMCVALTRNWWAIFARGVAAILFGIFAIIVPGALLVTLVFLFAAYLLVDGVFAIVAAIRAIQKHERWSLLLTEGVFNLLLAAVILLLPAGAILTFVLLTAAWAVITGGLMIGIAIRLGQEHGRWWVAIGGVISILWGVLLAITPLLGALALTWWFAVYAIAFGAFLFVAAFRLRRQQLLPADTWP